MEKVGIVITALCLCFILSAGIKSCKKTNDENLKIEREKGYKQGFSDGKIKAETDFTKIIEQEKKDFESQLEKDKVFYEQKFLESYNDGLQKGIEKISEEINSAITIQTEEKQKLKKSKQNWNEIISTGGE